MPPGGGSGMEPFYGLSHESACSVIGGFQIVQSLLGTSGPHSTIYLWFSSLFIQNPLSQFVTSGASWGRGTKLFLLFSNSWLLLCIAQFRVQALLYLFSGLFVNVFSWSSSMSPVL